MFYGLETRRSNVLQTTRSYLKHLKEPTKETSTERTGRNIKWPGHKNLHYNITIFEVDQHSLKRYTEKVYTSTHTGKSE
jgi:hypothetical protein